MVPGIGHHIWKLDIGSKVAQCKGYKQILSPRDLSSTGIEPGHSLEVRHSFEACHSFEVLEVGHSLEVRHSFEVLEVGHNLEVRHSFEVPEVGHSLKMIEPTLELSVPELKCKPVLVKPASDSHKQAERFVVLEMTVQEQRCSSTEYFDFRPQDSAWQGIVHQPEVVVIQHCSETGCKQLLLIDTFVVFFHRWRA